MRRWTAVLEYVDEVGYDHTDEIGQTDNDLQSEQLRAAVAKATDMVRRNKDRFVTAQLFKETKAHGVRRDIRRYVYWNDKSGRMEVQA